MAHFNIANEKNYRYTHNAEKTIMAKFNPWKANWRLFFQSFLSSKTCDFTMSIF